jgi:uncharacterized protein
LKAMGRVRRIYHYTQTDINTIRWQLKRDSINLGGIVERCDYGYPRIMVFNPSVDDSGSRDRMYEAVANVLWLTCPYLNEKIHAIEQQGYIDRIENLLKNDALMRETMSTSLASFYFFRKQVLANFGVELPESERHMMLYGIGGVRDPYSLKCLHAHFSHYRICEENVAGMITASILNFKINCNEVMCRNAEH